MINKKSTIIDTKKIAVEIKETKKQYAIKTKALILIYKEDIKLFKNKKEVLVDLDKKLTEKTISKHDYNDKIKTISLLKSQTSITKRFLSAKKQLKKTLVEVIKEIKKENTISIEREQYDERIAKKVLLSKKHQRWLLSIKLSKNQRIIYNTLLTKEDKDLNEKKTTFDHQNVFEAENFNFFYGENQALFDVNIKIAKNKITAFIGPSGCGKSTFLRCLNRMNDQFPNATSRGSLHFADGTNIRSKKLTTLALTTRVGMIFQKATPFPMSIYENIAYGPKSHGIYDKLVLDGIVKEALTSAALWDEVKDKLFTPATSLSGGQQQRLCIARAIALKPEVLLMDESTSGLDPIATIKIENLINILKKNYTIILVSHSMAQVQRVSDYTAFFNKGHMVEFNETKKIFVSPKSKTTRDYISGKLR